MSVATRPPKVSRQSTPAGSLPDAVRAWAVQVHTRAALCASNRMRLHPDLFLGGELDDWRNHLGQRERELIDAAMSLGIFRP